jgi:chromosome segregation ATPase
VVEAGSRVVVETKTESDYRANRPMTPSTVGGAHPSERGETPEDGCEFCEIDGQGNHAPRCPVTLEAEIEHLDAEINRRKGDPRTRLHNLCEGLERDKHDSPYSAESWDQLTEENNQLRRDLTASIEARKEVERERDVWERTASYRQHRLTENLKKWQAAHARAESAEASLKEAQQHMAELVRVMEIDEPRFNEWHDAIDDARRFLSPHQATASPEKQQAGTPSAVVTEGKGDG